MVLSPYLYKSEENKHVIRTYLDTDTFIHFINIPFIGKFCNQGSQFQSKIM